MPLRCKPGDLAVVVAGSAVGTFVDVLAAGPPHPVTRGASWECRTLGPCEVSFVEMKTGRVVGLRKVKAGTVVLFTDDTLWPIRPKKPPQATPAPSRELEHTT